jgi:site-specific DNA recombinase
MKSVLYCRVSSKEQEETGFSLPAQEKLLKEYAIRKDFEVVKIFSISESASGAKQRKVFTDMLAYVCKHNVHNILVEKVDRMTRNMRDAVEVNDWLEENAERKIHFVKQNLVIHLHSKSDEKFRWDIEIVLAKKYISNLSEEVKKGQNEKIAQGWYPNEPKLGYMSTGEKGHKTHIFDPDRAPAVKRMFEMYATGRYSQLRLLKEINNAGFRTRSGKKLVKSRLSDMLVDPFYIGKFIWQGQTYNGKHQPLISEEIFNTVQKILRNHTAPKYKTHFHTFRGLVYDKECGGMVTWETKKGIVYGHCSGYRPCSKKRWVKEKELEVLALDRLSDLQFMNTRIVDWLRLALKESGKDMSEYHEATIKDLNQQYERVQQRMERLYDDKLDGKVDEGFYQRKFKQYSDEKDAVLLAMKSHSTASNKYIDFGVKCFEFSQKAREVYINAKKEEDRRRLLSLVFNRIEVDSGEISAVEYKEPYALLAKAAQAFNSSKALKTAKTSEKIFEPVKNGLDETKSTTFSVMRSVWLGRQGSNLRHGD